MEVEEQRVTRTGNGGEDVADEGSNRRYDTGEMRNGVKKKTDRRKRNFSLMKKFGCLRVKSDEKGNVDMTIDFPGERNNPTHLVIMVNGLIGSSQNWRYAAKQLLKKYPRDLVVHCSKRNYSMLTFDGVDIMGDRLAEEVRSVINRHQSVQNISFVGHSLGGLIARYAVARLYEEDPKEELAHKDEDHLSGDFEKANAGQKSSGKIAGLVPFNFITSATPHLGSRGHKQVPLFKGSHSLERLATQMSWFLGRTGKHLFLTDKVDGKPPLLLRMVGDSEDLKFITALKSFKRRVVYANTRFDHLVGWSSSSIRRHLELPKLHRRHSVDEKYPHIVNVETPEKFNYPQGIQLEANANGSDNVDMEEQMIRGLTKLSWERIDVSFRGSIQRFLAHNTIQVKTHCINYAGADVVQHMVDNFLPSENASLNRSNGEQISLSAPEKRV